MLKDMTEKGINWYRTPRLSKALKFNLLAMIYSDAVVTSQKHWTDLWKHFEVGPFHEMEIVWLLYKRNKPSLWP